MSKKANLFYLAYGSNLLLSRMKKRVPSAKKKFSSKLDGFKLVFNKIGKDKTAKCNIEIDAQSHIFCLVYEIDAEERKYLDKAEGLGKGYEIKETYLNGVKVFYYIAQKNYIDNNLKPSKQYFNYVSEGVKENLFPDSYQIYIEEFKP